MYLLCSLCISIIVMECLACSIKMYLDGFHDTPPPPTTTPSPPKCMEVYLRYTFFFQFWSRIPHSLLVFCWYTLFPVCQICTTLPPVIVCYETYWNTGNILIVLNVSNWNHAGFVPSVHAQYVLYQKSTGGTDPAWFQFVTFSTISIFPAYPVCFTADNYWW